MGIYIQRLKSSCIVLVILLFSTSMSLAQQDIDESLLKALTDAQSALTSANNDLDAITIKQQPSIDAATTAVNIANKNADTAKSNLNLANNVNVACKTPDSVLKTNLDLATANNSAAAQSLSDSQKWLDDSNAPIVAAQKKVDDAQASVDAAQKAIDDAKKKAAEQGSQPMNDNSVNSNDDTQDMDQNYDQNADQDSSQNQGQNVEPYMDQNMDQNMDQDMN